MPRSCRAAPVIATMAKCTTRKANSAAKPKKWIVRADWNPPKMSSRNGNAAVIACYIVIPVSTIRGNRTKTTME